MKNEFQQFSPLMDDALRAADIARANLAALTLAGDPIIRASNQVLQLTLDYCEHMLMALDGLTATRKDQ